MKKTILVILGFLLAFSIGVVGGLRLSKESSKGVSLGYVGMAQKYLKDKKYIEAIAYFNRAISLDPNSFIARISLPSAYSQAGYYELAVEEYETTLEIAQKEEWKDSEIKLIKNQMEEVKQKLTK